MVFIGQLHSREEDRRQHILGTLVKAGGLPPESIGRIELRAAICTVAIRRAHAQQALQCIRDGRVKKKRIRAPAVTVPRFSGRAGRWAWYRSPPSRAAP